MITVQIEQSELIKRIDDVYGADRLVMSAIANFNPEDLPFPISVRLVINLDEMQTSTK